MPNRHFRRSALALALAAAGTLSLAPATAPVVLANVDHGASESYLTKAKQYYEARKFREASIELKNALRKAPDNAEARLLLGKIALIGNDLAGAKKEIGRAAALAPSDEADVLLGEIHLQEGNPEAAIAAVERPAEFSDMQVQKLVIAGAALMNLDRHDEAEQRFRAVLEIDSGRVEGHFGLARVFTAREDYAAANEKLDAILAAKPEYAPAWLLRGELSMVRGAHNEAFDSFTKAIELNPQDANALVSRARAHLAAGHIEGAKKDAAMLERLVGDSPIAHYIRAAIAFAEGDSDAANRSFTQLQRAFDEFPPAILLGALIKNERGELSQANSLFQRYIQMEPGNLDALRALAAVRMKMGQPSSAADILEKLLVNAPGDSTSQRQLASAYLALDRIDDARRVYTLIAEKGGTSRDAAFAGNALALLDPASAAGDAELSDPRFRLAVLKASDAIISENLDHAASVIAALEKDYPRAASVLALKGGLAGAQGDRATARSMLDAALEVNPELIAALNASEALDRETGDGAASVNRLRALLQRKPESEMLTLRLASQLAQEGRTAEALDMLRVQSKAIPGSVDVARALVSGLLLANENDEAIAAASRLAAIPGAPAPALVFAASALIDAGAAAKAVPVAEALTRALPNSPRALTVQAEALAGAGRAAEAYALLNAAAKRWPGEPGIAGTHVSIAVAQKDAKEARAAADAFGRHDAAGGARLRARALSALGQPSLAVEVLEAELARTSESRLAVELFTARRKAGKDDAAFAGLKDWLIAHPEDRGAMMTLATGYLETGADQKAESTYARFLELEPQNPVALNNFAWLRHRAGWADALDYAERAYRVAGGSPEIADTYGWMLVQYGRVKEGLAILEKAASAAPGNPEIAYHHAYALSKAGRVEEARDKLTVTLDTSRAFEARSDAEELLATLR